MSFYAVSTKELTFMVFLMSIIISAILIINNYAMIYFSLPEVYSKDDACVKVVNYENGHAFNCNDVNVILRKYRKVSVSE
jgi:hypothetical protein